MPASAKRSAAKKSAAKSPAKTAHKPAAKSGLGKLPEWNLADLYAGIDDPRVKRDLDRADADSIAFEQAYKGKLSALADGPGAGTALVEAVKRYEALDDLLGRLDLVRRAHSRRQYRRPGTREILRRRAGTHHGGVDRISCSSLLELNRLDDEKLEAAMADPALGHYRPWLEDIRKEKPYQLEDRVEQLFHEKSVTAYSAWNRLFDETIAGLRFKVGRQGAGDRADAQPDARPERRHPQGGVEGAGEDLQGPSAHVRADHQHARQGQGDLRPLARFRGRRRLPVISANRVEPEVVDALVAAVRAAYPRLSHRYYALKAHWFGKKRLPHWDRNAPLPKVEARTIDWSEAQSTVLTAYGAFSPDMAAIAERFFDAQLDRRAGAPRQGAGRVRASDRAVRASLRAAQLPGQAARRDDARARARPRRASGAGGAERRADGADAADARRDRERVRRDADVPQAARADHRARSSARPCSPPRSRT